MKQHHSNTTDVASPSYETITEVPLGIADLRLAVQAPTLPIIDFDEGLDREGDVPNIT